MLPADVAGVPPLHYFPGLLPGGAAIFANHATALADRAGPTRKSIGLAESTTRRTFFRAVLMVAPHVLHPLQNENFEKADK